MILNCFLICFLRPVHTMQLLWYNSFVLLCWNQRNDLRISEFETSCVRAKTKLIQLQFIHWALNKFSIELNRKLVQSSVNWFYYCTVKELIYSGDFYQRFDWPQPVYAKHIADWCWQIQGLSPLEKLDFRFLHKSGCREQYVFRQFQTEIIRVKWFQTEH